MPRLPGALLLILFGAGLLAIAVNGHRSGELPAGSRGLRPYRPNRADNPAAFGFFLTLYFCAGIALCVWGLLALAGLAPPLQWR